MSEADKLDAAFEDEAAKAKYQGMIAYLARGVNLCIEKGMIDEEHSTGISVSPKGLRLCGELDFTEEDLRAGFKKMVEKGYLGKSLYYDMAFKNCVSRGETWH